MIHIPPLDPHVACASIAHQLEADWGHGRKAMCGRHGEATRHFALHVRAGVIEIHCLTPTAFGWHAIVKVVKAGSIHGVTVRCVELYEHVRDGRVD